MFYSIGIISPVILGWILSFHLWKFLIRKTLFHLYRHCSTSTRCHNNNNNNNSIFPRVSRSLLAFLLITASFQPFKFIIFINIWYLWSTYHSLTFYQRHASWCSLDLFWSDTVKPRFNKLPRDRENAFVVLLYWGDFPYYNFSGFR